MEVFPISETRGGGASAILKWQQSGGDIEGPFAQYEDWSPLQLMAAEGSNLGVEALLECGARPDGRGGGKSLAGIPAHSPMHLAARFGHASIIKLLASGGGQVQARLTGRTV
jgi:hypothetical protein